MVPKYVPRHLTGEAGSADASARGTQRAAVSPLEGLAEALGGGSAVVAVAEQSVRSGVQEQRAAKAVNGVRPDSPSVLSFGSRGSAVVRVQKALRLVEDGWYGPVTTAAVQDFQVKTAREGLREGASGSAVSEAEPSDGDSADLGSRTAVSRQAGSTGGQPVNGDSARIGRATGEFSGVKPVGIEQDDENLAGEALESPVLPGVVTAQTMTALLAYAEEARVSQDEQVSGSRVGRLRRMNLDDAVASESLEFDSRVPGVVAPGAASTHADAGWGLRPWKLEIPDALGHTDIRVDAERGAASAVHLGEVREGRHYA